jgi:hypothetical protein
MDQDTVEHLVDAADECWGRYADAVGLRSPSLEHRLVSRRNDGVLRDFAKCCEKPVINMSRRGGIPASNSLMR